MPPISLATAPSNESEELLVSENGDAAFQVLNEDTLKPLEPTPATIKPLPSRDQPLPPARAKPNVVVYPTRRIVQNGNLEEQRQKHFTRSNGYIYTQTRHHAQSDGLQRSNFSNSYGNLSASKHRAKRDTAASPPPADIAFTKSLDAKLRRLQLEAPPATRANGAANGGAAKPEEVRKPFMTVVKTGTFLRPPPDLAHKLFLEPEPEDGPRNAEKVHHAKRLYAYASRPKVLNRGVLSGGDKGKYRGDMMSPGAAAAAHRAKWEAANGAAAMIASGVAGFARVRRESNGEWKLQADAGHGNIMFDKRVCRGNTYAPAPMQVHKWNPYFGNAKVLSQGDGESQAARAAEARRRAMARKKVKDKAAYSTRLRLGSPPPVKGRKHEPVQTELYLEEIFEHPEMNDVICQTDLFLDRPKSPFYYPAKVGVDAATQIYPGDLFDFDVEVQPILEVLVGKTIEQALIEVLEEEELAALREQQRRFEEIRNSDCAEAQRLEERERRFRQEKDRRMAEHMVGAKIQQETEERIAASVLMQGYIADLLPSVLEGLKEDGFILDNMKAEVDESFMPWLMKEVSQEMENMVSSRDVLSDIVRELLETRHELYRALAEAGEPKEDLHLWSDEEEDGGRNDNYGAGEI